MRKVWASGIIAAALPSILPARGTGLEPGGFGARSMSMAGADVAFAGDGLSSMGANPAGLAYPQMQVDVGFLGGLASGRYEKDGARGSLNESLAAVPEAAFSLPIGEKAAIGFSLIPDSLLLADWRYNDVRGGLGGVTYGTEEHRSELVLLRSARGGAFRPLPSLSLGASVGLLYNENRLVGPYIFQDLQPAVTQQTRIIPAPQRCPMTA